jgi:hypothetical protein
VSEFQPWPPAHGTCPASRLQPRTTGRPLPPRAPTKPLYPRAPARSLPPPRASWWRWGGRIPSSRHGTAQISFSWGEVQSSNEKLKRKQ